MENYCILCGEILPEGETFKNHHQFKKMCVNCAFAFRDDSGNYVCDNETNKENVKKKMMDAAKAVSSGYSVDNLEISPLPLKKPTAKCAQWELNNEVEENLKELFD